MSLHTTHASYVAADTQVSGSIQKIFAPVDGLTLNPTEFGLFVEDATTGHSTSGSGTSNSGTTQTAAVAIAIPTGTYLEGPIVATKCLGQISIVYHKGPLRILTP